MYPPRRSRSIRSLAAVLAADGGAERSAGAGGDGVGERGAAVVGDSPPPHPSSSTPARPAGSARRRSFTLLHVTYHPAKQYKEHQPPSSRGDHVACVDTRCMITRGGCCIRVSTWATARSSPPCSDMY